MNARRSHPFVRRAVLRLQRFEFTLQTIGTTPGRLFLGFGGEGGVEAHGFHLENKKSLRKHVQDADIRIRELQEKIEILDKALADRDLYRSDAKKAADFARLRSKLQQQLGETEDTRLSVQEALEKFEGA